MNDAMPRDVTKSSASRGETRARPRQKAAGRGTDPTSQDAYPWTVTVEIALPGETFRIHKTALDRIVELLRDYGPVIWDDAQRIIVAFGLTAHDYPQVHGTTATLVTKVTQMLGLPASAVANVGVDRADSERKSGAALDAHTAVVGSVEAAAILGVSKQRVAQLAHRPDFPKPLWRVRATPIWRAQDIRMFEASRRDSPSVRRFPRRVSTPPVTQVNSP